MTINIGLCGVTGRMGRTISERIAKFKDCRISAQFNSSSKLSDLDDFCKKSEIIIDFSSPEVLENLVHFALKHSTKLVIGTTGFKLVHLKCLERASKNLPILYSANMSIGANLLGYLAREAARILDDYDIEILDTHHRAKKDSPSGTAVYFAEIITGNKGLDIAFNRGNRVRKRNEIGIASLRGGNAYGTHDILFLGDDETITLQHQALNKNSFADGALKAAIWLRDKPPALYSMCEVYENLINYSLKKHL